LSAGAGPQAEGRPNQARPGREGVTPSGCEHRETHPGSAETGGVSVEVEAKWVSCADRMIPRHAAPREASRKARELESEKVPTRTRGCSDSGVGGGHTGPGRRRRGPAWRRRPAALSAAAGSVARRTHLGGLLKAAGAAAWNPCRRRPKTPTRGACFPTGRRRVGAGLGKAKKPIAGFEGKRRGRTPFSSKFKQWPSSWHHRAPAPSSWHHSGWQTPGPGPGDPLNRGRPGDSR
jgi:hypothetical protein